MAKDKPVWSGKRVMERWNSSPTELTSSIYRGLRAFRMEKGKYFEAKPEEIEHYDEEHMTDLVFRPVDVEEFEKEPEFIDLMQDYVRVLTAQEARELGELRKEKAKWNSSIAVAVQAGIHFANFGRQIIRDELQDFINKMDKNIPNTTIDKIWKAVPDKYKKGPGRPKKEE
jgi:hypothetical protein